MYAASECVRIFLCLAAQEKSLGASVAEGGGRWDMINFCPIEKKTLDGAKKIVPGTREQDRFSSILLPCPRDIFFAPLNVFCCIAEK